MVVGQTGLRGAHARGHVVTASKSVKDIVTILHRNTEGGDALVEARGRVFATLNLVQVKNFI